MTIAIALRVDDGVVRAADNAGTMQMQDTNGEVIIRRVFMNANKVANLRKGLPIGIVTWGALSIGTASMATIYKDLRARFSDETHEWFIPLKGHYSLKDVAENGHAAFSWTSG